jgi:cob(I)alamin adenosyltransferase
VKRLLIFTGDGKGKTTAAFGMAFRAAGHGLKVKIIQLIKADRNTGELATAAKVGIEVVQTGLGFVPKRSSPAFADHARAARGGLAMARETLSTRSHDIVILDEVCTAVSLGLIETSEVVETLSAAGDESIVVLTGRGAPAELIELADTVAEMKAVKHGFDAGMKAMKGVEF